MKPHQGKSSPSAKDSRRQQIGIDTHNVPDSLRPALQSDEVQEITEELTETIRCDPREQPKATPVASPGAPYRRRKTAR